MALDDLVKIGKNSASGEAARAAYGQDKTKNLTLDLAVLSGMDGLLLEDIKRESPNYAETRHASEYKNYQSTQAELSLQEISAIGSRDAFAAIKDKNVADYLLITAPVDYSGADAGILDAHKKAYKANQLKNNDEEKVKQAQENLGKEIQRLEKKKVNPAMIRLAASIEAGSEFRSFVGKIEADCQKSIGEFKALEAGKLRGYALARYDSFVADPGKQAGEAYVVAKAVAAA